MIRPSASTPLLVWTLALLSTVSYGALWYAQPLLAVATEETFGWSRTHTGLAFTLALVVTAVLAPRVGRRLDQNGGRILLTSGAVLGAVAFVILAVSSSYPMFVVGWLLAGIAMSLTFYEAVFTVLAHQLGGSARARASLTITLVAGLASTVFVPLTTVLLQGFGRQPALLSLAALLLAMGALVWTVLPNSSGAPAAGSPFVPDRRFFRLTAAFTLARIITVGVGLQLVPLLLGSGYPPLEAAGLAAWMGLAALPGRMLFMPLMARWQAVPLSAALIAGLSAATLLFHWADSAAAAVLGAGLFGMTNGALTLARNEVLLAAYRTEVFGAANGRMASWVNGAQALTPLGVGFLFTMTAGYSVSLSMMAGLGVTAVLVLASMGRRDTLDKPAFPEVSGRQ
ncbi:MFS transporter [Deinococcus deserti]|uniref:Putative major facilitator superfamily putative membrane protein n=1 Tax=Deinococcus deserti (strain DSM 17065 / CIP 109153 / LMG 22923 / VCD115) TaxID=546414 RepID=C1D2M8_DEIDV|nr:MFS transporter [Deinococcus deserti]ACO47667.1 putative major facilitator superfamily; putative membrane protein [Deinococcus deserti VCD115]